MKDQLNKAVAYVKTNPVKVAAITVGVAVTGFVIVKALQYGGEIPQELGEVAEAVQEVAESAA